MELVGFNFNKIKIEKFLDRSNELKINTTIDISGINKFQADMLKTKDEILGIKFNYIINYEPKFAVIEFSGNLLISLDPKMAKEVLKEWEEKKIPADFRILLFNLIIRKSAIKALELEDELNLPYHIPMPVLKNSEDQEKN